MFGVGWPEMLLTAIVAVIVIGPKQLPETLHSIGKIVRKIKNITKDFQVSLDEVVTEGELQEITREANRPGGENLQFEIERQLVVEEKNKKNDTTT